MSRCQCCSPRPFHVKPRREPAGSEPRLAQQVDQLPLRTSSLGDPQAAGAADAHSLPAHSRQASRGPAGRPAARTGPAGRHSPAQRLPVQNLRCAHLSTYLAHPATPHRCRPTQKYLSRRPADLVLTERLHPRATQGPAPSSSSRSFSSSSHDLPATPPCRRQRWRRHAPPVQPADHARTAVPSLRRDGCSAGFSCRRHPERH